MDRTQGAFYRVVRRELDRMVSRRLYFGVCIALPLFCILFMTTIFGSGQMENIPIGIVDLDQTATSRQISRTIATVPTSRVTARYADAKAARDAVQKKEIYAYVVIPHNFESDLLGGRNVALPYYYHFALLSVGIELHSAFETVLANLSVAPVAAAGIGQGASERRIESFILPVNLQAHPLFNPSLDYSIYLTNPFFFVLFQIVILLVTMYVLGSEIKFKTAADWLETADANIFTAVTGKLLPYTAIFIAMGILGNFVMFGIAGLPLGTGFLPVNLATALFIVATQAFGVFIFSLFPALSIIISIASMVGSLGATLSGVTFPVPYMYAPIYYLSFLFPVRHFVEINQNILYGDYGFAYTWQNASCLFVFMLAALLMSIAFFFAWHAAWWVCAVMFIGITLLSTPVVLLGIYIDLARPRLHWDSERRAMKSNTNTIYGMLLELVYLAAMIGLVFLINDLTMFIAAAMGISLVLSVVIYAVMIKAAPRLQARMMEL